MGIYRKNEFGDQRKKNLGVNLPRRIGTVVVVSYSGMHIPPYKIEETK
jgi:hypothetical protein